MSTKKRKRKYSNWSTQFDDNIDPRSLRQACYRSSRLATSKLKAIAQEYSSPRLCSGQASVQQSGTKGKTEYTTGSCELADEVSTETHNHILPYVNKLHDHRNRGQNAVFFDGQERVVKVVSFVSSLLDNTKKSILIIAASSSAILLWQMEFAKWSKPVKVVTYKGDKDALAAIRGSEFQVLLSSPDAIVEDMETLDRIKWELLVIDECQCSVISTHLNKIQMIMADMKLLTVTGELVNILQNYRDILSLVDWKTEQMDMKVDDICILKERLAPYIAFECKINLKEPSAVKVLEIPASALVPGCGLAGSGVLFAAPHPRSEMGWGCYRSEMGWALDGQENPKIYANVSYVSPPSSDFVIPKTQEVSVVAHGGKQSHKGSKKCARGLSSQNADQRAKDKRLTTPWTKEEKSRCAKLGSKFWKIEKRPTTKSREYFGTRYANCSTHKWVTENVPKILYPVVGLKFGSMLVCSRTFITEMLRECGKVVVTICKCTSSLAKNGKKNCSVDMEPRKRGTRTTCGKFPGGVPNGSS